MLAIFARLAAPIGRFLIKPAFRVGVDLLAWVALEPLASSVIGWAAEAYNGNEPTGVKSTLLHINSSVGKDKEMVNSDLTTLISTTLPLYTIEFLTESNLRSVAFADDISHYIGHFTASYDDMDERSLAQLVLLEAIPGIMQQYGSSPSDFEEGIHDFLESLKLIEATE